MEIEYTRQAAKQLDSISDTRLAKKLIKAIDKLVSLEGDIKKLTGYNNKYRLRVGDYRIIFAVVNGKVIIIEAILPRGNAYDRY